MSKSRYNTIIVTIVVVCGIFIANHYFKPKKQFNDVLMEISSSINERCPIIVDKDTRLDNTLGGPGNRFSYFYTMVNDIKEDLVPMKILEYMKPKLINNIKTNNSNNMALFRENRVEFIYVYRDKVGKEVIRIEIKPEDYIE